jgi:transposase
MKQQTKKHNRRVLDPNRAQAEMRFDVPDDAIADEHPARVMWTLVARLDLTALVLKTKSIEGQAGRSAISPALKLALWLYAISQGIGSAREIARLTQTDLAFRWMVSQLHVGHHTLSAFRVAHGEEFSALVTNLLAVLIAQGLISLDQVAQDGTRVRASASAPSFRRETSLEKCREQAALHVQAVLAAADDPEYTRAQHTAKAAAAKALQARVDSAIATAQQLKIGRDPRYSPPRASTTDPDARIMKMGDGGYRPAYNVQLSTVGEKLGGPRTIVGVRVTQNTTDMGSLEPMVDQILARTGQLPKQLVADAGHAKHADIAATMERGVDVVVPVPDDPRNAAGARNDKTRAVTQWRERMERPDAIETLRWRASACELSNAHAKQRYGMRQFLVRGMKKVTCVVMLTVLASNLLAHASALLA